MADEEEKSDTFQAYNPSSGKMEDHPLNQGYINSIQMDPKGMKTRADINYANSVRAKRRELGGRNHNEE